MVKKMKKLTEPPHKEIVRPREIVIELPKNINKMPKMVPIMGIAIAMSTTSTMIYKRE